GDGLSDDDETTLHGTDPTLADTDGDGLEDGLELGLVGDADPTTTTDPTVADTDGDGLTDGAEDADGDGAWTATLGGTGTPGTGESDPNVVDTDGDGLGDGDEVAAGASPVDTDTDDGDVDDFTEVTVRGTDPTEPFDDHWRVWSHPCAGNRTDALLVEDAGDTVFVGCGTVTTGTGLYTSTDAGATWGPISTTPVGFLASWRVNTLQRGDDGLLYVGGIDTTGIGRVVSVSPTGAIASVLENAGQTWNAMTVGTFRRTPSGDMVAESLTGYDTAFRGAADAAFVDGDHWETDGSNFQILDLENVGEDFYGVGSTINEPPVVFLPPVGGRTGFQMTPVVLASGIFAYSGELWDLHVDGDGLVAVGVDQGADRGVIFTNDGVDPYQASNWLRFDAATLIPNDATWFRGACRAGDRTVAVGEYSALADGLVVISDDGGTTWEELALPTGTGPVQRCTGSADGSIRFAGSDGFYAIFTP
ncbi:MAG: hypothetical protein R3F61_38330, partial [Myxococcota bacterium]